MDKGKKKKTKFRKLDLSKQHESDPTTDSITLDTADKAKRLATNKSVENVSNSLESVSLQDDGTNNSFIDTPLMNYNSKRHQKNKKNKNISRNKHSNSASKSEATYEIDHKSLQQPVAGNSSEVPPHPDQTCQTQKLNVGAQTFVPAINNTESTIYNSGNNSKATHKNNNVETEPYKFGNNADVDNLSCSVVTYDLNSKEHTNVSCQGTTTGWEETIIQEKDSNDGTGDKNDAWTDNWQVNENCKTSSIRPSKRYSDPRINREWHNGNVYDNVDKEYEEFKAVLKQNLKCEYGKVKEQDQDLFAMPKEYALAHCVAEDLRMGSGIAVSFKRDFKDIDILLQQRIKQGGVATLELEIDSGVRYIYYLVTKRLSNGKPTYDTFWSSLEKMRNHIKENNVTKLAMPRIGCGLDRLEWTKVKSMIEFLFKDVDVEIIVCNFQQGEESPMKGYSSCKVVHEKMCVADIDIQTIIIYFSTEDEHFSDDMIKLNNKFNFKSEFQINQKKLGDCIKFENPEYFLFGCIVRKTMKSDFDFLSFKKCLEQINRINILQKFKYVAVQAITDENDPIINEKLITIMKTYLTYVEIYFCWDEDLSDQMPIRRESNYNTFSSENYNTFSNEMPKREDKRASFENQYQSNYNRGEDKRASFESRSQPNYSKVFNEMPKREDKRASFENQSQSNYNRGEDKRASFESRSQQSYSKVCNEMPKREDKRASFENQYQSSHNKGEDKKTPIKNQWREGKKPTSKQ